VRILFIGDIVGSPGRRIVVERVADLITQERLDLVIANGENSASGFGITPRLAEELFATGIEVLSGGNHIWDRREIFDFIPHEPRLLRPANFPDSNPGRGVYSGVARNGVPYAVLCLQGRTFMAANDNPFLIADREIRKLSPDVKVIIVDIHAEATSEKIAMAWHLDGRVTAVLGTHTHVPTADEGVLPGGTAHITDVGMSGPHNGIIGMERGAMIKRFIDGMPARFEVATGDIQMNAVLIEADPVTGHAVSIERRRYRLDT
jgi:metallophosphoesterase (TIGR00282 family)